ncbi:MAG: RsmB/NOP family class I SAM-dependent RNA methyltransferase [Candidatus Aenigmarchaeota archaeon]|nr:RsmB/NOP family class I SAM-dependent RNA methyltransferase [Candidatus Aenigmarchaeota archaeon]
MNRSKTELTHKVRLFVSASVCLVFDPVSLVPCLALEPKEDDCILDMCAAPGTKTFILSFLTNNNANIIANDVNLRRVMRLRANAEKYGINCTITSESGRTIKGNFSKILVDAPCSGEGMINKKEKVFASWSERRIRFLAKKQKKLIKHAFEILEPGGVLVYSTCTFAPEENEGIIDFLLNKFDNAVTEEINVNINHASAITEWNGIEFKHEVSKGMRIYPHHNNTGGFFVARVRKG